MTTWEQLFIGVSTRANREIPIVLIRDGAKVVVRVTPVVSSADRFEIGDIGALPNVHPSIRAVNAGEPADRAGLKPGDVVLAVNGEPIVFSAQLKSAIEKHPDQPITLWIQRDGVQQTLTATPAKRGDIGLLGIQIAEATKSIQPGALQAVAMSIDRNVEHAGLIFRTVWDLITRETSTKQLMGPVGIAQLSGESAQLGWIALFSLMAVISLNLGLLNLLPIPVLDGGHIFIMALEGVARRDFSVRVKEKMLLAGFVALMMLMVTVIYNDLTRISWIERLMPWR